jgi:hypothetical protein
MEVPGGFAIGVSAERNPYMATPGGSNGLFYAVKFERMTALPRVARSMTRGIAYIDQNGNGQRDGREPGYPGAVIRQGMLSVVTDRSGEFEFVRSMSDSVVIDPLSLSRGWITGSVRVVRGRYEIGIVAVAPVEVSLQLEADSTSRLKPEDLRPVIVLARHESGKIWVSRKVGDDGAIFDALPPGRYTVELDLADLKEPLEPVRIPAFVVDGSAGTAQRIVVELRPRPVTIKRLGGGGAKS